MKWLVLGTGPGASEQLAAARDSVKFDTTITANRGIKILSNPTYYLLYDSVAVTRFKTEWRKAQTRGTKIIRSINGSGARPGLGRIPISGAEKLKRGKKIEADSQLDDHFWFDPYRPDWLLSQYVAAKRVGAFLFQYAANNGATEIHICGCKGFEPIQNYERMMAHIAVECAPKITTYFYGPITYGHLVEGIENVYVL